MFTLRAGNAVLPSPPGTDESSWLHVKEYPGCAQRFKGKCDPGKCVHGVGSNQQHYTCCGQTDKDAECPVKHLPLGVKLIHSFLSDEEQRQYVENLLQEPMVLKEKTLNFTRNDQLADKLREGGVVDRGNEWLRRLTHGNDHHPFAWSHGHFYNGSVEWPPDDLGTQPAHRDRGADVDRTLGVSVGAGMWFHYSLRDVAAINAGGGSAGSAFEHHVYVQSGDALLFDGMTLTHAADNMQPGTEPAWWDRVVADAGRGHAQNSPEMLRKKRHNKFLAGYAEPDEGNRHYTRLAHAVDALKRRYPTAGGITQEPDGRFSVRQGIQLKASQVGETSYLVSDTDLKYFKPSRLFIGLR
jgi:hypothetical protein